MKKKRIKIVLKVLFLIITICSIVLIVACSKSVLVKNSSDIEPDWINEETIFDDKHIYFTAYKEGIINEKLDSISIQLEKDLKTKVAQYIEISISSTFIDILTEKDGEVFSKTFKELVSTSKIKIQGYLITKSYHKKHITKKGKYFECWLQCRIPTNAPEIFRKTTLAMLNNEKKLLVEKKKELFTEYQNDLSVFDILEALKLYQNFLAISTKIDSCDKQILYYIRDGDLITFSSKTSLKAIKNDINQAIESLNLIGEIKTDIDGNIIVNSLLEITALLKKKEIPAINLPFKIDDYAGFAFSYFQQKYSTNQAGKIELVIKNGYLTGSQTYIKIKIDTEKIIDLLGSRIPNEFEVKLNSFSKTLNIIKDKNIEEMIFIPGGEIIIQGRKYIVNDFMIGSKEVINKNFADFLSNKKSNDIGNYTHIFIPGKEHLPAVNITFEEALDYCRFVGYRLPTLAEWLLVCKRIYNGELSRINWNRDNNSQPSLKPALGSYRVNEIYHLKGNVWEFCIDPENNDQYCYKVGGSYISPRSEIESTVFRRILKNTKSFTLGFRTALSAK